MSKKTPQTQKEFIDYRFTETNEFIADVKKSVDEVKAQLNTSFATKDYVDGKIKDHEIRLKSIEDDRKWLIRLVLSVIIVAVLIAARFKAA